jgi:ABC-type uncharacterized transport system permease subunit
LKEVARSHLYRTLLKIHKGLSLYDYATIYIGNLLAAATKNTVKQQKKQQLINNIELISRNMQ